MKGKQIFIVDDDESVCRALGVLLSAYGFIVNAFTSAEDFFRTVRNNASGCLILDIHMPGLDAWETMRYLFASGFSCPVIIVTANKNEGLREKALRSGAVGFLQKPIDGCALVSLVNIALEKKNKAGRVNE